MRRNLSSPPLEQSSYNPAGLLSSFASNASRSSRGGASRRSGEVQTPPLASSTPHTIDVDQVELQRLRSENQRNVRLLEDERRATQELSRRVAELERDLDHLKLACDRRSAKLEVSIPKFVVIGGDGKPISPAYTSRNHSFSSSASIGASSSTMFPADDSPRGSRSSSPNGRTPTSSVSPHRPPKSSSRPYVAFMVVVERGFPHPPEKVPTYRRFNEFKELHKALLKAFPRCPCIPDLPEKKPGAMFSKSLTSAKDIHERRKFLECYLRQLLCVDDVRCSSLLEDFFASNISPVEQRAVVSEEALVMDDPFYH